MPPIRLHVVVATALLLAVGTPAAADGTRPRVATPRATAREHVADSLVRLHMRLRTTQYTHATYVDENAGRYDFDCSGLAAWVLRRHAPVALLAASRGRPLAIDFFRAILRAPTQGERYGWTKLSHIGQALPGDVLAWQRPPWFRSSSTGHVAFVVESPIPASESEEDWLVRVADASKFNHAEDTRGGGTGFGIGTMLIRISRATGEGIAYGWYGSAEALVPTRIVFGRVTR